MKAEGLVMNKNPNECLGRRSGGMVMVPVMDMVIIIVMMFAIIIRVLTLVY